VKDNGMRKAEMRSWKGTLKGKEEEERTGIEGTEEEGNKR
jgi:hypothetical protein